LEDDINRRVHDAENAIPVDAVDVGTPEKGGEEADDGVDNAKDGHGRPSLRRRTGILPMVTTFPVPG